MEESSGVGVGSVRSKHSPVILLVDDFDDARDLYDQFLTFNGFHVLAARGGAEAIELARAHNPDVILLDIRMRDLSGITSSAASGRHTIMWPRLLR